MLTTVAQNSFLNTKQLALESFTELEENWLTYRLVHQPAYT